MNWIAFKIWYGDNTKITGKTYADWLQAPTEGVQVVSFYLDELDHQDFPKKKVYCGLDYYAMDETGVVTSSVADMDAVSGHILYGSNIDFDLYESMVTEAVRDSTEGWLIPVRPLSPNMKGDE